MRRGRPGGSVRGLPQVDETYVKVGGGWRYVYRAVDEDGQVIDVYVSPRRDGGAARRFFDCALVTAVVATSNIRRGHYEFAAFIERDVRWAVL